MTSATRRALTPLLTLPLLLLGAGACAGTPPIVIAPSACSTLVPADMIAPTPGAEPYGASPTAGDLVAFGDGQTAALDTANRDKGNIHKIVTACEARDAASVRHITRPWFKRLWPG